MTKSNSINMLNPAAWNIDCIEAYKNNPKPQDPPKEPKRGEKQVYRQPLWEDTIPFSEDSHLFQDSSFEMLSTDGFETIPSTQYYPKKKNGKLKRYEAVDYVPDYDILDRLLEANEVRLNQELDINAQQDERCITRFFNEKGEWVRNNLPRQIVEDCTWTGNRIETPQLQAPGANNIAHHLRIEGIMKFSPTIENLTQAKVMADVLKALDIDFPTWVTKPVFKKVDGKWTKDSLSKRVNTFAKKKNIRPWDVPVGTKAVKLIDMARALNDLEREQQEQCLGWATDRNIAMEFSSTFLPPEREPNKEILNTVGEYTYLKVSRIPKVKEFNDSSYGVPGERFRKIIQDMDNWTGPELSATMKDQWEKWSFEQRDRYELEMKRICNSRAREEFSGETTICEPALEPVEDTDQEPIETVYEEWSINPDLLEENGLDIDPELIDALNEHFRVA